MCTFEKEASNIAWENSRNLSRASDAIKEIFHYTGTDNLTKILRKKKFKTDDDKEVEKTVVSLMLSDIRCLNDYSETQDALRVYQKVCQKMNEEVGSIQHGFYECIKDLRPADTNCIYSFPDQTGKPIGEKVTFVKPTPCQRYVCCFSKKPNLLPMWNYYLSNSRFEGYSIGLRKIEIQEKTFNYFDTQYQPYIVDIVYEEYTKEKMIRDAISRLNEVWDEKYSDMAQHYLRAYLWSWCLAFKNEAFKHEEEIRIVIDIPMDDISWAMQPTKLDEIKIMYRNYHGLFTSYFYMYFEEYTLDSITIGPFSNSEQDKCVQEENVYSFLKKMGFNIGRGSVKCSDIPVRF